MMAEVTTHTVYVEKQSVLVHVCQYGYSVHYALASGYFHKLLDDF